jgi:signal transduction histidine kinase
VDAGGPQRRPLAAIIHDAELTEERGLLETAGAAAGLALENQRLHAELRPRVEELERSRERMIEAGLAERRKLERNLHDGAQQRLVALALNMRRARDRVERDPEGARELLDEAMAELESATSELRELARGTPSRGPLRAWASGCAEGARQPRAGARRDRRDAGRTAPAGG